MSKQSTIPFGPQHPVLPEPIQLDLVLEDEKVIEAIPYETIGFKITFEIPETPEDEPAESSDEE